jgi:hypothetical protein
MAGGYFRDTLLPKKKNARVVFYSDLKMDPLNLYPTGLDIKIKLLIFTLLYSSSSGILCGIAEAITEIIRDAYQAPFIPVIPSSIIFEIITYNFWDLVLIFLVKNIFCVNTSTFLPIFAIVFYAYKYIF